MFSILAFDFASRFTASVLALYSLTIAACLGFACCAAFSACGSLFFDHLAFGRRCFVFRALLRSSITLSFI